MLLTQFSEKSLKRSIGVDANFTNCLVNTTADACNVTQGLLNKQSVLVAIYNPLKSSRDQIIRIKVPTTNVQVFALNGTSGKVQLDADVICANLTSPTDCDLYFFDTFAALAFNHYTISPSTQSNLVSSFNAIDSLKTTRTVNITANRSITVYFIPSNFYSNLFIYRSSEILQLSSLRTATKLILSE